VGAGLFVQPCCAVPLGAAMGGTWSTTAIVRLARRPVNWPQQPGRHRHVIGMIVAYFRFLPANRPWLTLSLGLQLGGALGNLIDRLRQGYVVDFIAIKAWPVFDIADACVIVGVLILAYHLLLIQSQAPLSDPQSAVSHQHHPDPQ
jgi:hypothetical protein